LVALGFVKIDATVHVTPVSDLLKGRDEIGVAARKESEELEVTVSPHLKSELLSLFTTYDIKAIGEAVLLTWGGPFEAIFNHPEDMC